MVGWLRSSRDGGVTSVQRRDVRERLTSSNATPVVFQLLSVQRGPLLDQVKSRSRSKSTSQQTAIEGERGLAPLGFAVKVSLFVLLIVHPHDDAQKGRSDGRVSVPS